ncbi:MAG: PEP-CTERM sorting domain-containing protein [Verrucomicrobiales bacterium VVV1]|nr:MAG: PEP-CTERM sorting domain-containing protein [Verrucomicrobiales bacterium VVV1]
MKKSFVFLFFTLVQCITLRAADATRLEFDFAQSHYGFVAGFADYPQDGAPSLYQLTNSWRARPANLGGASALFISGINRSDDLFMFWKKRITGLPPNATVMLTMELQLASKYAEGLVGVGGAPGEGVTVKAGAVPFEPQAIVAPREGWLRMNLDKGNQSVGGTNMSVLGNVAKPDDGTENYVLLMRHQHGQPRTVTTASDGSLWLIFGTDSGFESLTALYYSRLTVWINRADKPYLWLEPDSVSGSLRLIWNQGTLLSSTTLGSSWPAVPITQRPHLHEVRSEPRRFWRVSQP